MPLITALIILANLAVYGLERAGDGTALCEAYGLVPATLELRTLVSSMFLHDPANPWHVGVNMTVLTVFGTLVEREAGGRRFLALYLAAGLCGGLLHVVVDPSATIPLVGASGAVFGVMAVGATLRPRLLGFVVSFAAIEIARAFLGGDGGVSFGCHLGGLFAGSVVAAILRANGTLETVEP